MRVQPFSYLEQKDIIGPPAGGAPFADDMLFWFKDAGANVTETTWNDSAPIPNTTGNLLNGAALDTDNVQLNNSSSTNRAFRINSTVSGIDVKSFIILFNQKLVSNGSGTSREYFYDSRDANTQSPNNAGYFNQYDSVDTTALKVHGNDATFFAYAEGETPFNGGTITTALLTDGVNNSTGGNDWWQWLGPNGRGVNTTKRVFGFNYNSTKPVTIQSVSEGWYIGGNSNPTEGASLNLYEMIGYNRALTFTEYEQLITYFQGTGIIT